MNKYDKLINEIQTENMHCNGELISPNHFRINTIKKDIEKLVQKVKNHQFTFLNINIQKFNNSAEFYFSYYDDGRDYLLSLVLNNIEDINKDIKFIRSYFPSARHVVNYFRNI